ncbi:glycosyltransferase [Streptomyces sp. QTS52]
MSPTPHSTALTHHPGRTVAFQLPGGPARADSGTATVEIVVPVYNEERALPGCLRTLHARLTEEFPFPWRITVADNASTDATLSVAHGLAEELPGVDVVHLDRKGRGLALRVVWSRSDADVVAYMDVDLSTGLDGLLPLVAPLATGHSDIAIGSRLAPGARTVRGPRREFVSRCYNGIIRLTHGVRFTDAQCGFKAARTEVLRPLLEVTRDDAWFFDTELLLLAEHNGLRVHEVPVDWVEDIDTRVDVVGTATDDLKGLWRMARLKASGDARVELPRRPAPAAEHPDAVLASPTQRGVLSWEVGCFIAIGIVSTVGQALLYWLLRGWWQPAVANLVSLLVLTVLNTEANRRLTFRHADARPTRAHLGAGGLFLLGYLVTSGAVLWFKKADPGASAAAETAVLAIASVAVTGVRFAVLRMAVFRSTAAGTKPATTTSDES